MIVAGIDAGSRAIKVVLYDTGAGAVAGRAACDQGVRQEERAARALDGLLAERGLARGDVARVIATGYGRAALDFADAAVTEITCHARGVRAVAPGARTAIDIGGQDSKVIWLDAGGSVRDFVMNDRCAAGTGRFLEVVAARLDAGVADLGAMAAGCAQPVPISSTCVVFAETEIVGLLASAADPRDIAAGVQKSVASRIAAMVGRRAVEPVVLTGGVALVPGMAAALATALGHPVALAPTPQFTGALGAALLAAEGREYSLKLGKLAVSGSAASLADDKAKLKGLFL